MLQNLLIVLAVGVLCGAWALLQMWLQRQDPQSRSIYERSCDGSGGCGSSDCGGKGCQP